MMTFECHDVTFVNAEVQPREGPWIFFSVQHVVPGPIHGKVPEFVEGDFFSRVESELLGYKL